MPDKFNNKYRIPSSRLQGFDYGNNGAYFITICTKERSPHFGSINIKEGQKRISLSDIGNIASEYWFNIPERFSFIKSDEFQVMPDYVHGIIIVDKKEQSFKNMEMQSFAFLQPYKNKFGPQLKNLASIIRSYKAAVKSFANKNQINFEWQERFYDHIIRDEEDFRRIRSYIRSNINNREVK